MEILDRLRAFQFRISRTILFFWIKPTVLGASNLELSDDDSVCYVLPFRSTADLLVTDRCSEDALLPRPSQPIPGVNEKRAVFFVGHPEGRFGRRTQRVLSERMVRLFTHQNETTSDIKIVPVSIFWGHQPDREKSLYKLILSENWTVTNRLKKLLAIIFHPRHILIEYSAPLSLRQLITSEPNPDKQIRKLLRVLRVHFRHQRQAVIGPDLSHRRTLINTMLSSNAVRQTIEKEVVQTDAQIHTIEKKALAYAREIASHQSYRVIRFFHVVLTWLWHKLYDGIEVNNVEAVQQAALSNEIIYVPCHRSHIDYLLLSYVLYHNGLTPPHIAAGKNLNLPIVGPLLRRAGAFFMRRSFQGDALYRAIFDEYLHQMFVRGYSVEYFIEGGRSRTGRTLDPKTGMLSMTMRSFARDASRPICLMPVYFGYERVLEVATYMSELTGKDKKTESLLDIFGVLRSFRYSFGKVTVNFGAPLMLDSFLDENLTNWRTPGELDNARFSAVCGELARKLATEINRAVAINPVTLVATALLGTPRQIMEEQQLLTQIGILRSIARGANYSDQITVTDAPSREVLEKAIEITGITREQHAFGTTINATPELSAMLAYYRNNVANIYAIPSLIARFVMTERTTSIAAVTDFLRGLYPYLRSEYFLPFEESDIQSLCTHALQLLHDNDVIEVDLKGERLNAPEPTSVEFESLVYLAEIIEPTLERFHIVATLLASAKPRSVRQLESDASAIAQRLSTIYGINSPTFFDKSLFGNFINTLKSENMVQVSDNRVSIAQDFTRLSENAAATLDIGMRHHVLQALSSEK